MISALKEYKDTVLTPSFKWVRKHWKGYTVFLVIYMAIELLWIFRDDVIFKLKAYLERKKKES